MFDIKRQRQFDSVQLKYGLHKDPADGMCAMEVVAYLADEAHSDHPDCACPVLTAYTIRLNDAMPEQWRQRLKPYLPLLIDTRDGQEVARGEVLAWHAIRVFVPMALEARGLGKMAAKLRTLTGDLQKASDAAYGIYASAHTAPPAVRAAIVHAAHAAHSVHAASVGRAAHAARAVDASDAADCAIAVARVIAGERVWPLALAALDEAIAVGKKQADAAIPARQRLLRQRVDS